MAHEVEAKFRLGALPKMDDHCVRNEIRQGYLDFNDDKMIQSEIENVFGGVDLSKIKEARIRAKGSGETTHYYFTLKSDGTLSRDEFEEEIGSDRFERLWPEAKMGRIAKIRSEIDLGDGLIAEVDQYGQNLEGLYTLEVEFDPEEFTLEQIIERVQRLDSSAENVTELKEYKNARMAKRESLTDLEEMVNLERGQMEQELNEGRPPIR